MYLYKSHRPTWAEIQLDAVYRNLEHLRALAPQNMTMMAVVKADAYGHGAVMVSQELLKHGVEYLAVSSIDEALELRNNGISLPVLILGPVESAEYGKFLEFNLFPSIISLDYARELSEMYRFRGVYAKVHINVDTGMGRLGIRAEDALLEIEQISQLPNIIIDGIYSHFPSADVDPEFSEEQCARFTDIISEIKKIGIKVRHFHIANSAAMMHVPPSIAEPYTMVRPGLSLYGYRTGKEQGLTGAMTLKSRIAAVRRLKKGDTVSYLRTFKVQNDTEYIAVIPAGYADGIPTVFSSKGRIGIGGRMYPVAGRVTMDYTMVSLGANPEGIKPGDEAVIFGKGGLSVEEFGKICMRIPYEVTCDISKRVPRLFILREDNR